MMIYEVNCLVDKTIENDFMKWLPSHIEVVLASDGFVSAETLLLASDDQLAARPDSVGVSIRYFVKTQDALDEYFNHHAQKLRQEGIDRFADNFTAYRRVLLLPD